MKRRVLVIISILITTTLSCSFPSLLNLFGSKGNSFEYGDREITIYPVEEKNPDSVLKRADIQFNQMGSYLEIYIESSTRSNLQPQYLLVNPESLEVEQRVLLSTESKITIFEEGDFDQSGRDEVEFMLADATWDQIEEEIGAYDYVLFAERAILNNQKNIHDARLHFYDSSFENVKYIWVENRASSSRGDEVIGNNNQGLLTGFVSVFIPWNVIELNSIEQFGRDSTLQDSMLALQCTLISSSFSNDDECVYLKNGARIVFLQQLIQTSTDVGNAPISPEDGEKQEETDPDDSIKIRDELPIMPSVGDRVTSIVDDMILVYIPSGSFLMGKDSEYENILDWHPAHEVTTNSYWMDIHEVTNTQFALFLSAEGNQIEGNEYWYEEDAFSDLEQFNNGEWHVIYGLEKHPATNVTWYGAQAYCNWAGRRLPTEAEWEKASRGGLEGMKYPWGNKEPVCRYNAEHGAKFDNDGSCDETGAENVQRYWKNGYGLYDMAGNVAEWVNDLYSIYPGGDPENFDEWDEGTRVIRGGTWEDHGDYINNYDRYNYEPTLADMYTGFRCVVDDIDGKYLIDEDMD